MLTSTLLISICSVMFLLWWHTRLKQAERFSTMVLRDHVAETIYGESGPRLRSPAHSTQPQNVHAALRGMWLFADLDERQIALLAQHASREHVNRGDRIVRQGEIDGGDLFCVLDGYFKVTTHGARSRELLINILEHNESFGEIGCLDYEKGRSASVTALTDGELLRISGSDMNMILNDTPKVALAMLTAQSRLVRTLTERAEDNAFLDVRTRLAKRLIALADKLGEDVGPDEVELKVALTQEELGGMSEATRTSVGECLNEWARQRVIQRIDDRLVIVDRERLRHVAAAGAV